MDASYKIQRGIHVHLIQFFMCPEFWVHISKKRRCLRFSRGFRGIALAASKASVLTLAISALRKCLLGCPQTRWTSGHRDQKKRCLRRRP